MLSFKLSIIKSWEYQSAALGYNYHAARQSGAAGNYYPVISLSRGISKIVHKRFPSRITSALSE